MEYALQHTERPLTEPEGYFGTPYPCRTLDLITVPENFGGARENIGAIVNAFDKAESAQTRRIE